MRDLTVKSIVILLLLIAVYVSASYVAAFAPDDVTRAWPVTVVD